MEATKSGVDSGGAAGFCALDFFPLWGTKGEVTEFRDREPARITKKCPETLDIHGFVRSSRVKV